MVLVHPDRASFLDERPLAAPFEGTRPELAGIHVVDLRRRYLAAGLGFDAVALDKVGHLSPQGHAFVAEVLRDELARTGAIRRGASRTTRHATPL